MILADYFRSERDTAWDFAIQSGVRYGVIRLPEDKKFDYILLMDVIEHIEEPVEFLKNIVEKYLFFPNSMFII